MCFPDSSSNGREWELRDGELKGKKVAFMEIGLLCQSVGEFRRHLMHVATSATGKALL